ncbi:hypothetical protein ScalyP_jg12030, partial [Parmales sp. scaly parma]
MITSKGA